MELKKEQAEVVYHDGGDLLVSASAGSGKTFTMIRRLIRLIVEGKARVSEILAVTFTEKAAAEMKEKLLRAMLKEISAGNEKLKVQLAEVYTADICTVHAFCGRLLRKYFFEAGISQDFEIADETRAAELKNRAIDELFEELYTAGDARFALLIDRHARRRKDKELKEIVLSLCDFALSEADPFATLEKSAENYTAERAEYFYGEVSRALFARYEKCGETYRRFADELHALGEEKGETCARIFAEFCFSHRTDGKLLPRIGFACGTDSGALIKARMSEERKKLNKIIEDASQLGTKEEEREKLLSCKSHTDALVFLCESFLERYALVKREENVADFSDLEHLTLKLMQNDGVRGEVRSRYKYVFADEYQDTNGVQERIFDAVSDGNLFMVGDLKQSIYGFRGCNSALFAAKETKLAAFGRVKYLNTNFRSAPAVIKNVNYIFDHCMKKGFSGVDYAGTSRLCGGEQYKGHEGRFSFDVLVTEKKKREQAEPRVYDILEENAQSEEFALGNFLADLIEEEIGKEYFDAESGSLRSVGYGDIAVLLRSRGAFGERLVKQLLRRGIPAEAEAGSLADYAEIRALIDVLRLTDNFRQDVPLCSALKNLYAFTDEELAAIRAEAEKDAAFTENPDRTFYDAYSIALKSEGSLGEKLRAFDAYMKKLRLYSAQASAADVLRAALNDTELELRVAASFEGDGKMRRVERFVAAAENFFVRDFLRRIENAPKDIKLSEAAGADSVKILTVHASKGLEYPVVFLAGLDKKFNFTDSTEKVLRSRDYGFAVQYFDDERRVCGDTVLRKFLKNRIREETVKEELRLFYVALTRAKYALHLVGTSAPSGKDIAEADKYADFLPPKIPFTESAEGEKGAARDIGKVFVGKSDEKLEERIRQNLSFVYPYKADTLLKLKTSVTAAAARNEDEPMNYLILDEEITTERGIAMHKFMENLDFSAKDAQSEISRQVESGALSFEQQSLLSVPALERIFASGLLGAFEGFKLYREQFFTAEVPAKLCGLDGGDILLQGIIDLLAVKGESAVLVDYKYSKKDAPSLKKTYAAQLSLYKYAVEKALSLRVEKVYLFSLAQAELIEM